MIKWFAEYIESAENRRKLATRLGIFATVGSLIYSAIMLYAIIFWKE